MSIFRPFTIEEFEELFRPRLPLLRGLALRILRQRQDADDALQNALMKGWNRCFLLRTPEKLLGWIGRIVINESYNLLRRKRRQVQAEANASAPEPADVSEEEARRLRRLEAAIEGLPPLYRDTMHIACLSEADSTEAANLLGCSVNTLYQRIHQAKKLLREAMQDE